MDQTPFDFIKLNTDGSSFMQVGRLGFVIEIVMKLVDLRATKGSWSFLLSNVKHWQSKKAPSMLDKGLRINHMVDRLLDIERIHHDKTPHGRSNI